MSVRPEEIVLWAAFIVFFVLAVVEVVRTILVPNSRLRLILWLAKWRLRRRR